MEVKINKEIMDYSETMFFGLSLRQFFFSVLACGMAVLIYFRLEPLLGLETTSWLCIVAAFPLAAIGFLKYNGMTAEQFIWAWIKDVFLTPGVLTIGNSNYYYAISEEAAGQRKEDTDSKEEPQSTGHQRKGVMLIGRIPKKAP